MCCFYIIHFKLFIRMVQSVFSIHIQNSIVRMRVDPNNRILFNLYPKIWIESSRFTFTVPNTEYKFSCPISRAPKRQSSWHQQTNKPQEVRPSHLTTSRVVTRLSTWVGVRVCHSWTLDCCGSWVSDSRIVLQRHSMTTLRVLPRTCSLWQALYFIFGRLKSL